MRNVLAVLCTCAVMALGVAAGEAQPRDRYADVGESRPGSTVSYSSDCCYKKIVRTIREVRYVRISPPYGWGPDRPRREGHVRPHAPAHVHHPARYSDVYVRPARRLEGSPPGYFERRRSNWQPYDRYDDYDDGYNAYNAAEAAAPEPAPVCTSTRVRVLDGKGGWVWGTKRVCFLTALSAR